MKCLVQHHGTIASHTECGKGCRAHSKVQKLLGFAPNPESLELSNRLLWSHASPHLVRIYWHTKNGQSIHVNLQCECLVCEDFEAISSLVIVMLNCKLVI